MPADTEIVPAVWDIASAVAAKEAGATTLFLSGGAVSANLSLPDMGLITTDYLVDLSRSIVHRTGLPLFIDGETGFGEGPVLAWFAERLLDAGVTGLMIEDQDYSGQAYAKSPGLCSIGEMRRRIEVAIGSTNGALKIIARTDILSPDAPFDSTMERLVAYRDAGAESLMTIGLRSKEELAAVTKLAEGDVWAVARLGAGYLPNMPDCQELDCRRLLVLYHQRMAVSHLIQLYRETLAGNVDKIYDGLMSLSEMARMLQLGRYTQWVRPTETSDIR